MGLATLLKVFEKFLNDLSILTAFPSVIIKYIWLGAKGQYVIQIKKT